MLLYFYIIFCLYYIFVFAMFFGWRRIPKLQDSILAPGEMLFVSIVVAVRNEEKNITKLLRSLERQTYPADQFEVIIVDDHSEDKTENMVKTFSRKTNIKVRLIVQEEIPKGKRASKKIALQYGIENARGEIIVTTDGDCWVGKDWLMTMVHPFASEKISFVSGPVVVSPDASLFSKIQALEFSSLIGSGAALIQLNYPMMCNGANLAFRKSAFEQVDGYKDVDQYASGDDVFLMQKIYKRDKRAILFNKSQRAIVYTNPVNLPSELIVQRRRWASKWDTNLLPFSWGLPVFLFIHYVSFLALLVFSITQPVFIVPAAVLIIIKFSLDFMFLKNVMNFSKQPLGVFVYLISEILYPIYALLIGILVHFGQWNWKGRMHKK